MMSVAWRHLQHAMTHGATAGAWVLLATHPPQQQTECTRTVCHMLSWV
jgi:hypothetical protein